MRSSAPMPRWILASSTVLMLALGAAATAFTAGAAAAGAGPICVGTRSGCMASLQNALDSAPAGSVVRIEPGTVTGGVTITKDLDLIGAGPALTTIRGGGPVVTIGTNGADTEPTVRISGITITGGVTRSSALATAEGSPGQLALGGGIEIPPNAAQTGGATVTIVNSVITANRVAPAAAGPDGPPCPNGPCPFALASGGGIDNWGALTLRHTTISHNRAGAAAELTNVASDAEGGGIDNWTSDLRITDSVISKNTASVSAPNGRFADSGGVFDQAGNLTMTGSLITGNRAAADIAWPDTVSTLAIAGGIHLGGATTATITDTVVTRNSASMTNTAGSSQVFSGGLHTDSAFTLDHDVITRNTVSSRALSAAGGDAEGDSGAGEMGGTITDSVLSHNHVDVSSVAGNAYALAGATIVNGTVAGTVVSGNTLVSHSRYGAADAEGAGLDDAIALKLNGATVSANTAATAGPSGVAQGGGIADSTFDDGPPTGPLSLTDSRVAHNQLDPKGGTTSRGGGIFTDVPASLTRSVIALNKPDQYVLG